MGTYFGQVYARFYEQRMKQFALSNLRPHKWYSTFKRARKLSYLLSCDLLSLDHGQRDSDYDGSTETKWRTLQLRLLFPAIVYFIFDLKPISKKALYRKIKHILGINSKMAWQIAKCFKFGKLLSLLDYDANHG